VAPAESETATTAALLDALRALDRELRLLPQREEARTTREPLPPARARVLRVLAERPAHSLVELAERTHTDPSSVSVVVQRLVGDGLGARATASDDRRRTELSITGAGRVRLRREPATVERRLDDAIATLGEQRAALVARGLQALADALRPTANR
jgi:DNA-binding MarR family transcriptional regulator